MEWCHVWWPWLTFKRVARFVSISWASCFFSVTQLRHDKTTGRRRRRRCQTVEVWWRRNQIWWMARSWRQFVPEPARSTRGDVWASKLTLRRRRLHVDGSWSPTDRTSLADCRTIATWRAARWRRGHPRDEAGSPTRTCRRPPPALCPPACRRPRRRRRPGPAGRCRSDSASISAPRCSSTVASSPSTRARTSSTGADASPPTACEQTSDVVSTSLGLIVSGRQMGSTAPAINGSIKFVPNFANVSDVDFMSVIILRQFKNSVGPTLTFELSSR